MNLLGKVLVVAILVMSVLFMGLAMAVYSTHQNWHTRAEQLQTELTAKEGVLNANKAEHNRLESQLRAEIESAQQQVRKLETERVNLTGRLASTQTDLEQLRQEQRNATAAVAATQQSNQQLMAEVGGLRGEIREAQTDRDASFAATVAATEAAHQVRNQLETVAERHQDLTERVADMTAVIRAEGLDPNARAGDVKPKVDGVVSRVQRRGGTMRVEITIGSDDGLKPGHTVEVFRGDRYLGRIVILTTDPDRAVGQVDRNFQQGPIQEGDRVATRLRLG
jgi:septal ring factor EnvC (AmiA/AmiB activator)